MKIVVLKNAFLILWISCFFVICTCSSQDIDPNLQSAENVTESQHQQPMEKANSDQITEKIPPDKESHKTKSDSNENGNGKTLSVDVEVHSDENAEVQPNKSSTSETVENVTQKEATLSDEASKQDGSIAKESLQEHSSNMSPPTGNIQQNVEGKEQQLSTSSSETRNGPVPEITEKKTDNQSETVVSGKADTSGSDLPEDGADVPTFDEYQRKFTGKRDSPTGESNVGVKQDESLKGGSVVTKAEGNTEATTPQPGNGANNAAVGRFKNVGSTSCGAKVVSSNDEASNPAHVLNENRDEYMNHPCTARKWFVVEACEPVRLRQVDIASYELFSSMVKTFRISASERYPQKLWDMVGTFTAKNEKGVQTYRVEQDKYYKYFKFEVLEHHGNEHFCPLSLIRLYGILMEDDDGEEESTPEEGNRAEGVGTAASNFEREENSKDQDNSRSLIQSATKVLVDIVKKTLQPKKAEEDIPAEKDSASPTDVPPTAKESPQDVKTDSEEQHLETRLSQLIKLLMSGEYSFLFRRCLELLRQSPAAVQDQLISQEYIPTPSIAFVECSKVAVNAHLSPKDLRWAYLIFNNASLAWEPEKRAAQFGDIKIAETEKERKNPEEIASPPEKDEKDRPPEIESPSPPLGERTEDVTKLNVLEPTGATIDEGKQKSGEGVEKSDNEKIVKESDAKSITKQENDSSVERAAENVNSGILPKVPMYPSSKGNTESEDNISTGTQSDVKSNSDNATEKEGKDSGIDEKQQVEKHNGKDIPIKTTETPTNPHQKQKEPRQTEPVIDAQTVAPTGEKKTSEELKSSTQAKGQDSSHAASKSKGSDTATNGRNVGIKENAYMRLSNKLRAMEKNVTMSMAYLEELSRNYKKKTDKISKNMEIALQKLQETATKGEERDRAQHQRILVLEKQIEELRNELRQTVISMRRENTLMSHGILLQAVTLNVILIIVHLLITVYCSRRHRQPQLPTSLGINAQSLSASHMLHNGTDLMNGNLQSAISNSDTNLVIVDPPFRLEEQVVKKDGKKKKKRKKTLGSNQQSSLPRNGFRDRSASESRIEDLL